MQTMHLIHCDHFCKSTIKHFTITPTQGHTHESIDSACTWFTYLGISCIVQDDKTDKTIESYDFTVKEIQDIAQYPLYIVLELDVINIYL